MPCSSIIRKIFRKSGVVNCVMLNWASPRRWQKIVIKRELHNLCKFLLRPVGCRLTPEPLLSYIAKGYYFFLVGYFFPFFRFMPSESWILFRSLSYLAFWSDVSGYTPETGVHIFAIDEIARTPPFAAFWRDFRDKDRPPSVRE